MRQAPLIVAATLVVAPGAAAFDVFSSPAAVDQPRINFAVARAATPDQALTGPDFFGGESILAQGFFDTGASGVVLSPVLADTLGIDLQSVGGETVVFGDSSADGIVPFNVSEPLVLRLTDHLGAIDGGLVTDNDRIEALSDPVNFTSLYDEAFGPFRTQVGPAGSDSDLSVIGMPAMQGKVVVMDGRPSNNFVTLLDEDPLNDDFDAQMRTYVYDPGEPDRSATSPLDPGIPRSDLTVKLTYADFSRFTTIEPTVAEGAVPPRLNNNPFIGSDPLGQNPEASPPVQIELGGSATEGSFLLDTGAGASFVSTERAADLGVTYDPANPPNSANPRLLGVPLEDQFVLQFSGIGGDVLTVPGFFADRMLVRSEQGEATNDDDPLHLNWRRAPLLVFDVEILDPDTNETVILDGIFGMNNLVASANFVPTDFFPAIFDAAAAPFKFTTFDEPAGTLGFDFDFDVVDLPGDANGDERVDLADFGILRSQFGQAAAGLAADFNGDGVVTLADFGLLRGYFGFNGDASASDVAILDAWAASVPEPGMLAIAGAAGLLVRRRSRGRAA